MKSIIDDTMQSLDNMPDKSWESVVSELMLNPSLEPMDDFMACSRKDSLANDSWGAVKFDEITDKNVLNDVEAWFSSLISVSGDEDVINSTRIDIRSLGNIVASTGASCVEYCATLTLKLHTSKRIVSNLRRGPILRLPSTYSPTQMESKVSFLAVALNHVIT